MRAPACDRFRDGLIVASRAADPIRRHSHLGGVSPEVFETASIRGL